MNEASTLVLALLAGAVLGTIFFGCLWWTIRMSVSSRGPPVWFGASFLLRTAIAVGGFYFVGHDDWRRLLACLLGFMLARFVATRLAPAPVDEKNARMEGGSS